MPIERDEMKVGVQAVVPGLVVDGEDVSCMAVGQGLSELSGKGYALIS